MQFDFSFLGNRDYVYSASIYNALMAHLKGVKCTDFELSCHKIARFNCQISENKPANLSEICFVAKFKKDGKITQIYGTENINSPILKREDYDEDEIFKRAKIDFEDKSVSLQTPSKYGIIEEIVALHKFLLQNLYKEQKGKWFFARLELDEIPLNRAYPLKLKVETNFNFKLVKSKILIGTNPPPPKFYIFCLKDEK